MTNSLREPLCLANPTREGNFVLMCSGYLNPPVRSLGNALRKTRSVRDDPRSADLGDDGNIELRVVLLHVAGPVLVAEFFDHRRDLFDIGDGSDF